MFRQRLVWPLGRKLQRISQKVIIVTTSTFISSYYGWPLGLTLHMYIHRSLLLFSAWKTLTYQALLTHLEEWA